MYPYPSSSHSQPHPHPSHLSSQPPPLYPPPHLPPPSSLNGAIPPLANSSALPPHTLPLSSQHPSNSTYRSFPSSILAPMSPTRTKVYPRSDDRPATSGSPRDMDESGSDDDDDKEKHKLEIRREKNRVKQRNLRMRRANHIAELETNITALRGEHASLQSAFSALQQREVHLESWIRDLESALFRHGFSGEVDAIRRAWSIVSTSTRTTGPTDLIAKRPRTSSGRDSLSTLAQAALGPEQSGRDSTPLPPLASQWDQPPPSRSADLDLESGKKKRKRDSDSHLFPPMFWKSTALPSQHDVQFPGPEPISPRDRTHDRLASHEFDPRQREHSPRRPTVEPASSVSSISALAAGATSADVKGASWRSASDSASGPTVLRPTSSHSAAPFTPSDIAAPSPRSMRIEDLLSPMAPPAPSLPVPDLERKGDWHVKVSQPGDEVDPEGDDDGDGDGEEGADRDRVSEDAVLDGRTRWSLGEASLVENVLGADRAITISIPRSWNGPARPTPSMSNLTHLIPQPSVFTARSGLLHHYPSPVPFPLPRLPDLAPQHRQILLVALTRLSPPGVAEQFRTRQLRGLPSSDAKAILEYQSSSADPLLVLFPVAILRARVISHLKRRLPRNLTHFITQTLRMVRVFGDPLDPDAWEMPDEYWDVWSCWFPRGREYCCSLRSWRRRHGHRGSQIVEMLMGAEGEGARMKEVGKPPGWSL